MAIQIDNKKKKVKMPKSLDVLFNFALALFLVVVGSYFLISFLIANAEEVKREIEHNIEKKKAEIPERENLEEVARDTFNIIEDFKVIVEKQKLVSLIFGPLEKMTHPRASISSVSVNISNQQMNMSGMADGFVSAGQQFQALKENSLINSVSLDGLSLNEDGQVMFSFVINLKDGLLDFNNIHQIKDTPEDVEEEEEIVEEEEEEEEEVEINEIEND